MCIFGSEKYFMFASLVPWLYPRYTCVYPPKAMWISLMITCSPHPGELSLVTHLYTPNIANSISPCLQLYIYIHVLGN